MSFSNVAFSDSFGAGFYRVAPQGDLQSYFVINAEYTDRTITAEFGVMGCDTGYFELCLGEKLVHAYDTTANVTGLGSALSTGAWTLDSGTSVTLDSQFVNGNEVSAVLTAVASGRSVLKCIATYADGQKTRADMVVLVQ